MDLNREKKLRKSGFKTIAGIDEAGRGPISGPVTAAAATIVNDDNNELKITNSELKEIKDSKKLTEKQREHFYNLLNECSWIEWATSRVGPKIIDKINILEATKLAMRRAVDNLNKKLTDQVEFLMIDGNFKIDSKISQKPIIKGDEKVFLISVASIIAKVSRDRAMKRYDKIYPGYGFARHKGYPTTFHRKRVKQAGPCKIHRKTFKPIKNML